MYLDYNEKFIDVLKKVVISDKSNLDFEDGMEKIVQLFLKTKSFNKRIFFVGNGGSAGIAIHMTVDFLKNAKMKTQSLYDPSTLTCISNDFGYEHVFSEPLSILFEENDLLVAISSSGNSLNIVNAINTAKSMKGNVITFSGFKSNNKIRQLGDYNLYVPMEDFGIVESMHNMILQEIVDNIAKR